jgi:hypothetical protein
MNIEEAIKTYREKDSVKLDFLMNNMGSDKGPVWHNYSQFYSALFEPIRTQPLALFELGVGTNNVDISSNMGGHGRPGASLYAWSEFFTDASIYAADIDRDCLFEHAKRKIQCYYCDQTDSKAIRDLWLEEDLSGVTFDILIEDGLHEPFANKIFFEESHQQVKVGGVYIIEDINNKYEDYFKGLLEEWKQTYPNYTFFLFEIDVGTAIKPLDNWMMAAQRMY